MAISRPSSRSSISRRPTAPWWSWTRPTPPASTDRAAPAGSRSWGSATACWPPSTREARPSAREAPGWRGRASSGTGSSTTPAPSSTRPRPCPCSRRRWRPASSSSSASPTAGTTSTGRPPSFGESWAPPACPHRARPRSSRSWSATSPRPWPSRKASPPRASTPGRSVRRRCRRGRPACGSRCAIPWATATCCGSRARWRGSGTPRWWPRPSGPGGSARPCLPSEVRPRAGERPSRGRPGLGPRPPLAPFHADGGVRGRRSSGGRPRGRPLPHRRPRPAAESVYLSFDNAYHGDTLGAAAVGGVELFHETFRPILLPALKTPAPYCYRCPLGREPADCPIDRGEELEAVLAREGGRVCAVVLEPLVQAAAGMLVQPEGFLTRVAEACRRHGVLRILDEVATGFGRTGTLLACQREGVTPDLLCLAKGLTGGTLPLAATLATDAVYRAFLGRYEEYRHFFHGHTYTGNPLGCAAALATLGLLADGSLLRGVAAKARVLREALAPLERHRHVGEIRQAGLMCGVELVADRETKARFDPGDRVAYRLCLAMRERGVFIRPLGDVIVLMPPLTVTEDELRHLAGSLHAVLVERFGA